MKNGKNNEMHLLLSILKSPEINYNASSLARSLNISPMGALKIARRLENEGILLSKKIGKANIYRINTRNDYAKHYIKLLLKKEVQDASPHVKRWIRELEKLENSLGVILFGSILRKEKEANDIDALIIVDKEGFEKVKKEVHSLNAINEKKIHALYQTKEDFKNNIKEENKVVLNALKGIVIRGGDLIFELMQR